MSSKLLTTLPDIDFAWHPDGTFTLTGHLPAGLFRCRLHFTIAAAEWERFYYPMTRHGNTGQMTGPWDFDGRDNSRPLLPAWHIARNGRDVGYVTTTRISEETLVSRQLHVEFVLHSSGDHTTITATPHRPFTFTFNAGELHPDTIDTLAAPEDVDQGTVINWEALRDQIDGTEWETYLNAGVDVYLHEYKPPVSSDGTILVPCPVDALPLLAMAWRLTDRTDARDKARDLIDHYLALPAWGRPAPDSYGHNCDMFCATVIKTMALALAWFGDEGLDGRADALVQRLEQQIDIFLELQHLQCAYWGGAIAQDHGYRSSMCLAIAAMNMLGRSDKAAAWLAFYLPRVDRSLAALPTDGFLPFSNYHKISLYGLDLSEFAITLEGTTGRQVLQEIDGLRRAPECILSAYDETGSFTLTSCTRGDAKDFNTGLSFFHAHINATGSEAASYLAGRLMDHYRLHDFRLGTNGRWNWKAYSYLPFTLLALPEEPYIKHRPKRPPIAHFSDGGGIHFRGIDARLAAAVYCLPPGPSFHSLGSQLNPTDRIRPNPSNGAFSLTLDGHSMLINAESGYRTGTQLGNVLLVDNIGQYGNSGYWGSFSDRWRGERITSVVSHADGGIAILDLAPAYPPEAGILTYLRQLTFATPQITLTDSIVTAAPHLYAYCFHTYASVAIELAAGNITLRTGQTALRLRFDGDLWGFTLGAPEIVWAYSHEQREPEFRQIRFQTHQPQTAAHFQLIFEPLT